MSVPDSSTKRCLPAVWKRWHSSIRRRRRGQASVELGVENRLGEQGHTLQGEGQGNHRHAPAVLNDWLSRFQREAHQLSCSSLHDVPLALKRRWTQRSLVAAGNRVAGVEQIKCPAKTLEACWLVVLLAAVGVACCQGLQLLWCPRELDLHFLALTRLQLGCPVGLARRMSRLLQASPSGTVANILCNNTRNHLRKVLQELGVLDHVVKNLSTSKSQAILQRHGRLVTAPEKRISTLYNTTHITLGHAHGAVNSALTHAHSTA